MRYEGCSALEGRPNVMVDGAPVRGTVLTLSHWPATPTPPALRADLSAQIVARFRRDPSGFPRAELATIDHVDQDGLVALLALVSPERAEESWGRLVEVARAGDFAAFGDREAARISFALATLGDPDRSPLPPATLTGSLGEATAALASELLGRLPELVADPARFRPLWAEEDATLAESEAALASGELTIEEVPEVDLGIVTVPEGRPSRLSTRFLGRQDRPWHPGALHNRTDRLRLLVVQGRRYELYFRYESWVRLVSRPVAPRVALGPLAAALEAEERNGARWTADGVSALVPRLSLVPGAESSLSPERVRALVQHHLATAPPAWGPEGVPALAGGSTDGETVA